MQAQCSAPASSTSSLFCSRCACLPTPQDNLKGLQQQLQLLTAQHEAQQQESRAAMETLAEAEAEMAGVHFEKKQLVAQWRSSLLAIQK